MLKRAVSFLRDLVYPEGAVCLGCGVISDGRCLCPDCRDRLRDDDWMNAWSTREVAGVTVRSLRAHDGLSRQLVHRLKYDACACVAREIAEILLPLPSDWKIAPDTIVTWVPMHPSRRRERCVDHARLLAEAFAGKLRLLCRPLLIREKAGKTQQGLSANARKANPGLVFRPAREIAFPVLLIDDVLTTGTTVSRCVEALREGGARDITVLTFTAGHS